MELGERRERKGKKPSKQSPVWKIRHLAAGRGGEKNLGETKEKKKKKTKNLKKKLEERKDKEKKLG